MKEAKFLAKVDTSGVGCWLWTGAVSTTGYGRHGRSYAHRVAYELFVGPIPVRRQIDHLCRIRTCVRPDHLEPVTQRENTLRGFGATAVHARKTTCIRGHQFDGTRRTPCGTGRTCSACLNESDRRRRRRRRSALRAKSAAKEQR